MSMYNLAQLISVPTRITTTYTSSVIDLIFVSDPNKISQSCVGDVCAIDHRLGDGPFNIQGGGWDFSLRQVIFFSLFAQQVIFFKSKLQQVFYFLKK